MDNSVIDTRPSIRLQKREAFFNLIQIDQFWLFQTSFEILDTYNFYSTNHLLLKMEAM